MKIPEKLKSIKVLLFAIPIFLVICIICIFIYKQSFTVEKADNSDDISDISSMEQTTIELEPGLSEEEKQEQVIAAVKEALRESEEEESEPEIIEVDRGAELLKQYEQKGAPDEILYDKNLALSDIYAEKGQEVVFKCYRKDATKYTFEYYDQDKGAFVEIEDSGTAKDELGREVAFAKVQATEDNNKLMIRCRFDSGEEEAEAAEADDSETAFLYVLNSEVQDIKAGELKFNTGTYISSMDIPLTVMLKDGSELYIKGLYGLYFKSTTTIDIQESTNALGLPISFVTELNEYSLYKKITEGEQTFSFEYLCGDREAVGFNIAAIGADDIAPEITNVTFSGYEVMKEDRKSITVTAVVTATDNVTPYPMLKYAAKYKGSKVNDADYTDSPKFEFDAPKNGTYVIYCMDESGNVATYEKDIIYTDMKAPVIDSVTLEEPEGWHSSNKIIVEAHDACSMTYCFSNAETGISSGFDEKNEFEVTENGTYKVEVRDSAGNITEKEIVVSNIDSVGPVIKSITQED